MTHRPPLSAELPEVSGSLVQFSLSGHRQRGFCLASLAAYMPALCSVGGCYSKAAERAHMIATCYLLPAPIGSSQQTKGWRSITVT